MLEKVLDGFKNNLLNNQNIKLFCHTHKYQNSFAKSSEIYGRRYYFSATGIHQDPLNTVHKTIEVYVIAKAGFINDCAMVYNLSLCVLCRRGPHSYLTDPAIIG